MRATAVAGAAVVAFTLAAAPVCSHSAAASGLAIATASSRTAETVSAAYSVGTIAGVHTPAGVVFSSDGSQAFILDDGPVGESATGAGISVVDTTTNTVTRAFAEPTLIDPVALAASPNASILFVLAGDGTVDAVSASTGAVLHVLGQPDPASQSSYPSALTVSRDGKFAYASYDTNAPAVRVFDLATDTQVATLDVAAAGPVAVSPDGSTLWVASGDTVSAFDTASGTQSGATLTLPDQVTALVVDPTGSTLYAVLGSGYSAIATDSGAVSTHLSDQLALRGPVTISADGSTLYTDDEFTPGGLAAISTSDATVAVITGASSYGGVAISPDGSYLYAVGGAVSKVDLASHAVETLQALSSDPVTGIASPDGRNLYIAERGDIAVLDTTDNDVIALLPTSYNVEGLAISPDARTLFAADSANGTVSYLDPGSGVDEATVTVGAGPCALAISPDGDRLYVADASDSTVSVIDVASRVVVGTIGVQDIPDSLAISPDGRTLYVNGQNGDSVSVIDTAADTVTHTIRTDGGSGLAVSPDGRTIYAGADFGDEVAVISAATDRITRTLPFAVNDLRLNPAGTLMISDSASQVHATDLRTDSTTTVAAANFTGLSDLTVTASGSVYVIDEQTGAVDMLTQLPAIPLAPTPTIVGSRTVGRTLTARAGTWGPGPVALTYRWAVAGHPISGQTRTTFTLTAADYRKSVTATVTGTRAGYAPTSVTSAVTAPISPGRLTPTPIPTITGTTRVGRTLRARPGRWGPGRVRLSYQWYANQSPIRRATTALLKLTKAQQGRRISVYVRATETAYTASLQRSRQTSRVSK